MALRKATKKKNVKVAKKLAKPALITKGRKNRAATTDREEFWKKEIAALRGQRFASLDQALEALIDHAISKVSPKEAQTAELKNFLSVLLATDAEIVEILETNLDIG